MKLNNLLHRTTIIKRRPTYWYLAKREITTTVTIEWKVWSASLSMINKPIAFVDALIRKRSISKEWIFENKMFSIYVRGEIWRGRASGVTANRTANASVILVQKIQFTSDVRWTMRTSISGASTWVPRISYRVSAGVNESTLMLP